MNLFSKCSTVLLFNDEPSEEPDPNFFHNSGASVDAVILLLKKGGKKILLAPKMTLRAAKEQCAFEVIQYSSKDLVKIIKKHARGKIGIDFNSVPHSRYLRLKKLFKKSPIDVSQQLEALRVQKSSDEIRKIKKAVQIAKKILNEIEPHLSPKTTEEEIAKKLRLLCFKRGVSPSFPPIVAAGKNSASPHHIPSKKRLGKGIVLIDFGVRCESYCSDLTRCFFLGPCKKERKKYEEAQAIFTNICKQIPRLKTIAQLANYSDSAIKKQGWGKLIHSIGHGVGIEVHEAPAIYAGSKQPLLPSTTIALEPGWYGKDFGVRFEQNALITKKGVEIL
ncbi:MAG: Xaa-Pro peptidase family protein [Candidatus Micrarchaeota archaeon]